jgi:hypothetical protein
LIFGLPGETWDSFAQGFDRLYALRPHEIQLGLLKRLRGTPIARHTVEHAMVYAAQPPYAVQQTGVLEVDAVQRFIRLARYWDLVANSGRFQETLDVLLQGDSAFAAFAAWSDWLWHTTGKTHGLTPENLVDALFEYLGTQRNVPPEAVRQMLLADYQRSGAHAHPQCLQNVLPRPLAPHHSKHTKQLAQRQAQHGRMVHQTD